MTVRPLVTAFTSLGGHHIARRHVCSTIPRLASKEDVLFQGIMSTLYQAIFDQHAKPTGPWETIDSKLSKYAGSGSTVLDVATGPGEPGVLMAKRHNDMTFILSDLSEDMLTKAKTRAQGLTNVKFVLSDMQDMKEFEDESMDSVTCCYGLMFPPDVDKAVSEIERVLKPGGTFIATYWKELPMADFTNNIMKSLLGGDAPPPPINPLSLKEPGLVNKLLTNADLKVLEEEEHEYSFDLGSDHDFAFMIGVFPILPFLEERSDSDRQVAIQMFDDFVEEKKYIQADGDYVVPGNVYHLVVAKKE